MTQRVGLLQRDPDVRSLLFDVLTRAGHECVDVGSELGDIDTVFAEVDLAVTASWFAEAREKAVKRPRIILVSHFASFLRSWRDAGLATLELPTTPDGVLTSLSGADDVASSSKRFDWEGAEQRIQLSRAAIERALAANGDIAELVSVATSASIVLVNVVGARAQEFVAHRGLDDDLRLNASTPREWSFCQHVVEQSAPLVISDANKHPVLAATPLVAMGLVRAYAGFPIRRASGEVIGTVCAASASPRSFGPTELASLRLAVRAIEGRLIDDPRDDATLRPDGSTAPGPAVADLARVPLDPQSIIGAPLGDYYVTAHLGSGGESHVFLARHRVLGSLVVAKLLRDPHVGERLVAEGKALAAIHHPNVVQLRGFGTASNGAGYLIVEYLRGPTLTEHVRATRARGEYLSNDHVVKLTRHIAGALETLHATGFVHGDLKPRNVILDEALDRAVLIDFGLAMRLPSGSQSGSGQWQAWREEDRRVGGTPGYSAPEQMRENAPVASTALDVYALGTLAYHLLIGHAAFALTSKGITLRPPTSARANLPPALDTLFDSVLAEDPSRRPRSPSAFVDTLAHLLAGRPSRPQTNDDVARSNGLAFERLRHAGRSHFGAEKEAEIFALLESADQAAFASAERDQWYPADPLIHYMSAYANRTPIESLAAAIVRAVGPAIVANLHIDRAPRTLLRALSPILEQLHDWLAINVRPLGTHMASVQLRFPKRFAPIACAYFAAVVAEQARTVRRDVTVQQFRCIESGAPQCDLTVRWRD